MLDRKIKVREIRDLGAGNHLLVLNAVEQARLTRPGQFVMVKCSTELDGEPLLRRPFSVFDLRHHAKSGRISGLSLLVKDVGTGTHKLASLRKGDAVHVLGPQGRWFEPLPRIDIACLIAGGVGIAALYLLARDLISRKITPVLFYGGKSARDLVLREHFEALGMETNYSTEDGSLGSRGLVTAILDSFLSRRRTRAAELYACGPWGMMRAASELAQKRGVACQVSLEARMGCSLGACMGCVVHGWDPQGEEQNFRVCMEGPVMQSRQVDWAISPL